MDWISVEDELPPEDGVYWVTSDINELKNINSIGLGFYDGYGFMHQYAYRPVRMWADRVKIEKKYGKQK